MQKLAAPPRLKMKSVMFMKSTLFWLKKKSGLKKKFSLNTKKNQKHINPKKALLWRGLKRPLCEGPNFLVHVLTAHSIIKLWWTSWVGFLFKH